MSTFSRTARRAALSTCALAALTAAAARAQTAPPVDDKANAADVVVTATRDIAGVDARLLGSSITVLTAPEIAARQTQVLSDVLRDVPGVEVSRTGTVGGLTDVRIRGAESNHTLVLIDGIKVSDPYQDAFDFAGLLADEVAKLEVLRGEQSALYGSDAIGGVLNYITASGADRPGVQARLEGGSFGTGEFSGRVAGVTHGFDLAVSGQVYHTDGIVVAPEGSRNVGADIDALSARLTYSFAPNFRVRAVGRFSDTRADTDDQDYTVTGAAIDSDTFYRNRAGYGLVGLEYEGLGGRWRNSLDVQAADTERKDYEYGGQFQFGDKGRRYRASYVSTLKFGTDRVSSTLTGAVDGERDQFQTLDPFGYADTTRRHIDTYGVVGQYDLVLDHRLAIGAAYRHDANSRFRDDDTFHAQASYLFDEGTRLHAAGGSGVKDPGVFELFGYAPTSNFVGNPGLKPERSVGWEAGVEQTLFAGRARLDATYFDSTLTDEITTDYGVVPNTVINLGSDSTRRGVEVSARADLTHGFKATGAYTYLDSRQDGAPEIRRARNIASVNLDWRSGDDRVGAHVTARYNGDQLDTDFASFQTVRLPDFTLVTLGADYRLTPALQLYGRIENLLDQDYQEVFGFREPGRAAYAGVRAAF